MTGLRLDHITMAARTLAEGAAYAERALGIAIPPGGAHPQMGTHNRLLKLGDDCFLEVIAPDPDATPPARPRWFALDDPAMKARLAGAPQLITWVVATSDIGAALAAMPDAARPAIPASRGNLAWRIGVAPDGAMSFDGAFPTLIEWPQGPHPASRMADLGCSLDRFEVSHPDAHRIARALAPHFDDRRVTFIHAPRAAFRALIRTPAGLRELAC